MAGVAFVADSLTISQAIKILQEPPTDQCISHPPVSVKGSEVYIFRRENPENEDDWRADQIRWINNGVTALPRKNPVLKKSYFVLDTPNGPSKSFQRHAYQLIDSKAVTLIHYIGNEECVSKFPHRNANTSTPFVRTCPSYLKKCAAECKEKKANVVYKKEISQMTCQPEHVPTHTPRNMKQLRNLRFKHLHQTRISKDELYNLHEIAYDTPGYVHKISTFPDLVCVCGLQEILDEADKVLMLQEEGQLLSYDTTFQLGDFYVSPLLFRHTLFTEKPCVPAMYLIHERKFTETHRVLFQEAVRHIPSLKTTKSCMVTDKERAITKAAELEVPNLKMVQCWNHLFRDVRFWLRKHGAPAADITIYVDDVSQLFHSPSEEAYNQLLEQCCERWDASFEQYYRNEIHPAVPVQIGRWVLEQVHLYNPYCGITNNQSEGLNRVVKDFQSWKEAPLDTVVLALYQLQVYYYNEIKRGFAGLGQYHLRPLYQTLQVDAQDIEYLPTESPEGIVQRIKESGEIETTTVPTTCDEPTFTQDTCTEHKKQLSIHARARDLVQNNKVSFNPQMHIFNVKGTSDITRVVTLYPSETCSCPSTGVCYHTHLLRCLESQDMTMFPVKRERRSGYRLTVKGEQSYPVFCTCRLPVLENVTMVQCTSCKMWCHAGACVSVDKEALTNRKAIWTCPECPLPAQ